MSHESVLNINNFEQLLSEENFSNLLSTLSGKDNLEDSLQKLVEKKPIVVPRTVTAPITKVVTVSKKKNL